MPLFLSNSLEPEDAAHSARPREFFPPRRQDPRAILPGMRSDEYERNLIALLFGTGPCLGEPRRWRRVRGYGRNWGKAGRAVWLALLGRDVWLD